MLRASGDQTEMVGERVDVGRRMLTAGQEASRKTKEELYGCSEGGEDAEDRLRWRQLIGCGKSWKEMALKLFFSCICVGNCAQKCRLLGQTGQPVSRPGFRQVVQRRLPALP